LQGAIDNAVLALQRRYNRDRQMPLIYTPSQCYLTWSRRKVENDLERSQREGWSFAGKLVRGAYMDLERRLAAEQGYESPIMETYDATSANYNACAERLVTLVKERGAAKVSFMVAS
jgi:proline dehydrogenase